MLHAFIAVVFLGSQAPASPSARSPPPKPFDCSDPVHRQFDFWVGEWDVVPNPDTRPAGTPPPPPGQKPGHNVIQKAHGGCVVIENWVAQGQTGQSFNIYDLKPDAGTRRGSTTAAACISTGASS